MTDKVGSRIVAACEGVWHQLRLHVPRIPDAVIVINTATPITGSTWSGDRPADTWTNDGETLGEVAIAAAALSSHNNEPKDNAYHVFALLVHEATHAINAVDGNQDTSRQGRYHNRMFHGTARSCFGVPRNNHPSLDDVFFWVRGERYAAVAGAAEPTDFAPSRRDALDNALSTLVDALASERIRVPQSRRETVQTGYIPLMCSCGQLIRCAPSTYRRHQILCTGCSYTFEHESTPRTQIALGENTIAALREQINSQASAHDALAARYHVLEREHATATATATETTAPVATPDPPARRELEFFVAADSSRLLADLLEEECTFADEDTLSTDTDLRPQIIAHALAFASSASSDDLRKLYRAAKQLTALETDDDDDDPSTSPSGPQRRALEFSDDTAPTARNPNAAANASLAAAPEPTAPDLEAELGAALETDGTQNAAIVAALRECATHISALFSDGDTWHRYRLTDAWTMPGGAFAGADTANATAHAFSRGTQTRLNRQQARWILEKCTATFDFSMDDSFDDILGD